MYETPGLNIRCLGSSKSEHFSRAGNSWWLRSWTHSSETVIDGNSLIKLDIIILITHGFLRFHVYFVQECAKGPGVVVYVPCSWIKEWEQTCREGRWTCHNGRYKYRGQGGTTWNIAVNPL